MKKDRLLKIIIVISYIIVILIQQIQIFDKVDCFDLFLIPRYIYEISLKQVILILISWIIEKLVIWIYCYKYLERFIDDNAIYILVRAKDSYYLYFYIQRLLLNKIMIFVFIKVIVCLVRRVDLSLVAILLFVILILLFENVALLLYLISNDKRALAISVIFFISMIIMIHQIVFNFSLENSMYNKYIYFTISDIYISNIVFIKYHFIKKEGVLNYE